MGLVKTALTAVAMIAWLLAFTVSGNAALVSQWTSTILDYSTQYSDPDWAAYQALGVPDTPVYGDIGTAWAPEPMDGTKEYITLGYTTSVYASSVTIRETNANGFVYRLDVMDQRNNLHTVWTGTDPSQPGEPVDFTIPFSQTPYMVKGVKIFTDTDHELGAWEEIDAVQLSGVVPLPSTWLLLGSGLLGMGLLRRRMSRKP